HAAKAASFLRHARCSIRKLRKLRELWPIGAAPSMQPSAKRPWNCAQPVKLERATRAAQFAKSESRAGDPRTGLVREIDMRNPIARVSAVLTALALFAAAPAFADGPGDAGANVAAPVQHHAAAQPSSAPQTITGQSGQLTLMGGEINLNVPQAYRFYPAETALA